MSLFDLPVSVVLALWAPLPSPRGIAVVEGADGAHEVDDSASPWGLGRLSLGRWLAAFGPLSRVSAALASPADPLPGLAAAVDAALAANPGVADRIRAGKVQAAGAIVGAVMKATRGQADAKRVRELVMERVQS